MNLKIHMNCIKLTPIHWAYNQGGHPQIHEIAKEISRNIDTAEDLAQWYLTEKQVEEL